MITKIIEELASKAEPKDEEKPPHLLPAHQRRAKEEDEEEEVVLNPSAPRDNALMFVGLRYWNKAEGCSTLKFWQKQFWRWDGTHWKVLDDDTVRAKMYEFLDEAYKETGSGSHRHLERFEPDQTAVNKTIDALRSGVNLEPENEMPGWLWAEAPVENVKELVACQNGLLDVRERRLIEHTPRFWSPNVVEFDFDHRAKAPRFEQFLREVWPGDEEAQQQVVEMMGVCVTDETKYQKAWMLVGPQRGGRGTIGRVLQGLVGKENYIGTTLRSFGEPFGMQSFIGKKVVVFSDARLDGVSRHGLSLIAERLLTITGEDAQDVNRKYLGNWSGVLKSRLIFFSNELLRFQDESGALAGRFNTNRMTQSFLGREDKELTNKLLAERSGILNLALDALDRLRDRGRLIQPASGLEMGQDLRHLTSDILAFVDECLEVNPNLSATVEQLFAVWNKWCEKRMIRHGWGLPQFSEKLRSACPTLRSSRPRKGGPTRPTTFLGIGIRGSKVILATVKPAMVSAPAVVVLDIKPEPLKRRI